MIGENIRNLRKKYNKTQDDLAKFLGIAPQTIYKYEKGINEPDLKTTQKIADYFHISVDELLGRTESSDTIDEPIEIAASTKDGIDLSDICEEDKKTIMNIYNMIKNKNKKD